MKQHESYEDTETIPTSWNDPWSRGNCLDAENENKRAAQHRAIIFGREEYCVDDNLPEYPQRPRPAYILAQGTHTNLLLRYIPPDRQRQRPTYKKPTNLCPADILAQDTHTNLLLLVRTVYTTRPTDHRPNYKKPTNL